jgi:hypothetical protein
LNGALVAVVSPIRSPVRGARRIARESPEPESVARRWIAFTGGLLLALQCMLAAADDKRPLLSWQALAQVSGVMQKGRYIPTFPKGVAALDKREVKLEGFMMPLDMGVQQKRFLLTAVPSSCGFCLPGGAEQIVEVQARTPVKYVLDPVVVSGRFVLVHDDAGGLLYRLIDAIPIDK